MRHLLNGHGHPCKDVFERVSGFQPEAKHDSPSCPVEAPVHQVRVETRHQKLWMPDAMSKSDRASEGWCIVVIGRRAVPSIARCWTSPSSVATS